VPVLRTTTNGRFVPAMLQWPIRRKSAKKAARAFVARKGRRLLQASPTWAEPRLRAGAGALRDVVADQRARRLPLLSIVVPCYNVEDYIGDCLRSLLAQTYRNIEIIVVDDGSPDRSYDIAAEIARTTKRIRIVRQPNGGLSAARNTGIRAATGEFLTFVDSDDLVGKTAYATAMDALLKTGSDFAVFGYRRFDSTRRWNAAPWIRAAHAETRLATTVEEFPQAMVNAVAWSKVYRRDFWDAAGLSFPEGVLYEDQPVSARAFAAARTFDLLAQSPYLWREREDASSISQQVREITDLRARFAAAFDSLDHLRDAGLTHAYTERARQLVANSFSQSLSHLGLASDEFWDEFTAGLRELFRHAPEGIFDELSPQHRVMYALVLGGFRAQAVSFLEQGGGNVKNFPSEVVDGRVRAMLPYYQDPEVGLAPTEFEFPDHRLELQTAVRRLWWSSETTIELTGWAYIDNIDLADSPTHIELQLVHDRTGATITVPTRAIADANVSRISKHKWCDYEASAFAATIDTTDVAFAAGDRADSVRSDSDSADSDADLGEDGARETGSSDVAGLGTWHVLASVRTAGVERIAPMKTLNVWGSAGLLQGRGLPGDVRTSAEKSSKGALQIRRRVPGLWLTDLAFDGTRVRLRVAAADERVVRSLVISDRSHFLRHRFGVDRIAGGWEATVRLPRLRAGWRRSSWEVRAHSDDGRSAAISWGVYEDRGAALLPTAFDGLWAERTPVGNVSFTQQRQRFEVGAVALDESAGTLGVDATFVGAPPVAARLRGSRATGTASLTVTPGHVHADFDLQAALWGAPPAALPPGRYEIEFLDSDGEDLRAINVETSPAVLALLPLEFDVPAMSARLERARGGRLSLTVVAPLRPDERGSRHQRELQAWHASAVLEPRYNAALFRSYFGENTACNARAVHRELRTRGSDLDLFWAVTDHSVEVPEGGIPVVHESRQWYELLGAAKYVMDNMHQPIYHVKRAHQVVIETFHGYPFKVMGHRHWEQMAVTRLRLESFDRRAREWDYLVSPARYATPLLRRDFRYDGEVLEIGYPRNDVLLADTAPARRAEIRELLGIRPDQQVVLYAPTFRDYMSADDHSARMVDFFDLDEVSRRFGEHSVLLVRGHAFNARAGSRVGGQTGLIDVTRYPDVADLYLAADAAVVDYSSLRFDFGVTGKPMVFHVPDLERYRDDSRGWLFDFEPTAPGPLLRTTDEVLDALSDLDDLRVAYADAYETFRRDFLDLEDGHAAARFVDAVFVSRGDAPAR
jgi:CDP-glycerol glycerophosphotransferase